MRIYVCAKHVPDTASTITVVDHNRYDESVKFIMNPYDEIAVEEAVRVKQQQGDSEVIVITVGGEGAVSTLRAALAMGADRAILIKTDEGLDSIMTARALKKAIEQEGKPDLVFAGKQSIDREGMQTMYRLAEALGMATVSNVVAFSMVDGQVGVEREMEAGARETVEMRIPCLVGAGRGLNTPRLPKFSDIIKAKKAEIKQIDLADLELARPSSSVSIIQLRAAQRQRRHIIFQGTPDEAVNQLAQFITEEIKVS
jgi:electron transfer flavoprotein beta subunit